IFVYVEAGIEPQAAERIRAVDIRIMISARTDMQRDAVQWAAVCDRRERLVFVIHPGKGLTVRWIVVPAHVLGSCSIRSAPGSGGLRNDFVRGSNGFNRIVNLSEAVCVICR